jgi:cell division protein FtsN
MANAWSGAGPVSLPPRWLAYLAGGLIFITAVVGVGLGFLAAWRAPNEPGAASENGRNTTADGELVAHPIVELPPPAAPTADKSDDAAADAATDAEVANESIASKTAAAQALQSKASNASGNIDDILTSPQEKPPAPVKSAADEAPPTAPVKSDVPF